MPCRNGREVTERRLLAPRSREPHTVAVQFPRPSAHSQARMKDKLQMTGVGACGTQVEPQVPHRVLEHVWEVSCKQYFSDRVFAAPCSILEGK